MHNVFFSTQAQNDLKLLSRFYKTHALAAISTLETTALEALELETLPSLNSTYHVMRVQKPGVRIVFDIEKDNITIATIKADKEFYDLVNNRIGNI